MVKTLVGTLDPDEDPNFEGYEWCAGCQKQPAKRPYVPEFCKQCDMKLCRLHYNKHMVYTHRWPKDMDV